MSNQFWFWFWRPIAETLSQLLIVTVVCVAFVGAVMLAGAWNRRNLK